MGHFETKHSPYYAIIDDSTIKNDDKKKIPGENSTSFWILKRANFNNECRNASLFEFNNNETKQIKAHSNDSKSKKTNKRLILALNQIKVGLFLFIQVFFYNY